MLVSIIFYVIFGIFTVTFLKGTYYHCEYEEIEHEIEIDHHDIVTKYDCLNWGGEWMNEHFNFDNIGNAILLLYSISTVDWNNAMMKAVSATGIDS